MLSRDLELTLAAAFREAESRRHEFVTLEHLLYAMLHNDECMAIINACGGEAGELRSKLEEFFKEQLQQMPGESPYELQLTLTVRRLLDRVVTQVKGAERNEASAGDVLAALMLERDSHAAYFLQDQGISRLAILEVISHGGIGAGNGGSSEAGGRARQAAGDRATRRGEGRGEGRAADPQRLLQRFTTDLTERAAAGKIDPLIGRNVEVERALQVLGRRQKNNPVLVGDAGVGKTAIVEGMAVRIAAGEVPATFRAVRIFALDMGMVLAGTKFRGDFEARIKGVIEALQQRSDAILFIDEIHTIVGAGATSGGSMDASNILKPALSGGELRCIGSTTYDEYRRYFEKDHALSRRFQKIVVNEPSVADTVKILRGLRSRYETFHHVRYSDRALHSAAELAAAHIHDRRLPDKAIDVIDEAGSRAKMRQLADLGPAAPPTQSGAQVADAEQQAGDAEAAAATADEGKPIGGRRSQGKQSASPPSDDQPSDGAAAAPAAVRATRPSRSRRLLSGVRSRGTSPVLLPEPGVEPPERKQPEGDAPAPADDRPRRAITVTDIAAVVAAMTGRPVSAISSSDRMAVRNLPEQLRARVFGQDAAIDRLTRAIKRNRAGLGDTDKPIGAFLLTGPTGVGKTEVTRQLADILGVQLIRIDMSEYQEKHTVSRLIGAPPGYVGYDEGGLLTDAVIKSPYAVVLLDEIEKAHPDVFDLLLQIMDHASLTDGNGRRADFHHAVLVMTSNAGGEEMSGPRIGFADGEQAIPTSAGEAAIKRLFRPEFINRLDAIVTFQPLERDSVLRIVDKQAAELNDKLRAKRAKILLTDAARDWLGDRGYDPVYGARPLARLFQREVSDRITDLLLDTGRLGRQLTVDVDADGEQLAVLDEAAEPIQDAGQPA